MLKFVNCFSCGDILIAKFFLFIQCTCVPYFVEYKLASNKLRSQTSGVNRAANAINAGLWTNTWVWQNCMSRVPHAYAHTAHHGVPSLSCQWHHLREPRRCPTAPLTPCYSFIGEYVMSSSSKFGWLNISSSSWLSLIFDVLSILSARVMWYSPNSACYIRVYKFMSKFHKE